VEQTRVSLEAYCDEALTTGVSAIVHCSSMIAAERGDAVCTTAFFDGIGVPSSFGRNFRFACPASREYIPDARLTRGEFTMPLKAFPKR